MCFKSTKFFGRDDSLYKNLLAVQIHEAAEIGTSMVLEQNGNTVRIPGTRSQLIVDTKSSPWKIFVPKDIKAQKACYKSQVPKALLQLLGISGPNATMAIYRLTNEPYGHEMETEILEEFDILKISWVTQPSCFSCAPTFSWVTNSTSSKLPVSIPGISVSTGSTPTPTSSVFDKRSGTPSSSSLFGAPASDGDAFCNPSEAASSTTFGRSYGFSSGLSSRSDATANHRRSVSATPTQRFSFDGLAQSQQKPSEAFSNTARLSASPIFSFEHPPPQQVFGSVRPSPFILEQKYRALLENIINRVSGNDSAWNFNNLADAVPETVTMPMLFDKDQTFSVHSNDRLAHDMKIAAAGELFV